MQLVISIAGDAGQRLEKHDLSETGLTIGRGWDCDVILQDRRVDPLHLRMSLNAEGAVVVQDLMSLNGTRIRGKNIEATTKVGSGVSLHLGKTTLQVFAADHEVRPALSPSIWDQLREIIAAPRWVAAISLVSLIGLVRLGYLQTTTSYEPQQALSTLFYAVGLAGIWAVAWGLLGRLLRNESHILAHWSVALAAGLVGALLGELVVFFAWITHSVDLHQLLSVLSRSALYFVVALITLSFATHLRRWTRVGVAALPGLLLLIGTYAMPLLRDDNFRAYPEFVTASRPPSWQLSSPEPLAMIFIDGTQLFTDSSMGAAETAAERKLERVEQGADAASVRGTDRELL